MTATVSENRLVENQIELFFHNNSIGKLLHKANVRKQRVSLDKLFQFLLARCHL